MEMHEIVLNTQSERVAVEFIKKFCSEKQELYDQKILNDADKNQIAKLKHMNIPEEGRSIDTVVNEMMEDIYQYGCHTNHTRFLGFIPGPASEVSWLGDIMTSAYNLHAGSFMNCPAASCIEQELIQWLCEQAGYTNEAGGLFVSGGSMANMTALCAARDKMLTEERQHLGVAYVSDQTHSSVAKGLRIIGIPNTRLRKIPTDMNFRMDMKQLECAIQADIAAGLVPFTVIASVGSTNTGSIDPLEEIALLCNQYNLWMHVDGAFGASVLLTKKYKHLLKGIELSDSISWDAHKWLFQTYGCGMVLVKDKANLVNSYHTNPEYLKDLETDGDCINPYDIGMELTRPARGLKLWLTLQVLGSDRMGAAIEHGFQLVEWAEDELKKNSEIEIISPAQLAIINFRYAPQTFTEDQKDELNLKISKKMIDDGYAGVFTTVLNGKKVLRICAIHPEATEYDMRSTVQRLNQYFNEIYPVMKAELV
ncbi:pyridoxal phosphate-dependent decarboxylase family protein [Lachnoclostridium phytofermentans]|uniref:Pyridoxal-dependent decarboxylase n=1 Tax=Lachnoclostridium phytofermentans (strain ATCC 700394 / DSM 18823 / ISDg) TaxID=357809 RepID=A9KJB1_LACP7|nr:aminotransferase class I/II-fold pyridoxal phosphate-dependent enzyme [Lachnoclostridium phytofermentans]ABX42523.1 Pyridoxal-dependent decarboxylase [Lachnoclostridium phytofermentans ISDg]